MPAHRLALLIVMTLLLAGCGGTPPPRGRMGGLPYPGAMTLYAVSDPRKLGHHRYDQGLIPLPPFERSRGLVYTCGAGFVDLAHLRAAVDWTRYYADHVRDALRDREQTLDLAGPNRSRFRFAFHYPDDWSTMPDEHRGRVVDELSARIGERAAYAAVTWHEVITWYGYKSSLVFDESPSSFTWDDVMSHVVGIRVGGRAWRAANVERRGKSDYNRAVTEALAAELAALHAATPKQTGEAVRAVEGRWWRNGKPLRRQLDVGLTTGRVAPWTVGGLSFCPPTAAAAPRDFALPDLLGVFGRDYPGLVTVAIDPRIGQAAKIRRQLPDKPEHVSVERDLPLLVEAIRGEMRAKFGDGFDRP